MAETVDFTLARSILPRRKLGVVPASARWWNQSTPPRVLAASTAAVTRILMDMVRFE